MIDDQDELPSDAEDAEDAEDADLKPKGDKAVKPTSQPEEKKDEEGPSEQPS